MPRNTEAGTQEPYHMKYHHSHCSLGKSTRPLSRRNKADGSRRSASQIARSSWISRLIASLRLSWASASGGVVRTNWARVALFGVRGVDHARLSVFDDTAGSVRRARRARLAAAGVNWGIGTFVYGHKSGLSANDSDVPCRAAGGDWKAGTFPGIGTGGWFGGLLLRRLDLNARNALDA
jgi:hypothetical protein